MKKRITLWLLATLFLANVSLAEAQQAGKVTRIGFLDNSTAAGIAVFLEAFRHKRAKLRRNEGHDISRGYRCADLNNKRVTGLAAELVRLKVDLFVASGATRPGAAKRAATTIPTVMTSVTDPVGEAMVGS